MDTEKVEKARNGNVDEIGNLLMENMKLKTYMKLECIKRVLLLSCEKR